MPPSTAVVRWQPLSGPIFPEQDPHDPNSPMSTCGSSPHSSSRSTSSRIWVQLVADRQIGAPMRDNLLPRRKDRKPLPQTCSMLSVTKEHERTGSFMPCVGGQSGVQDAYLQLVIKRCHKSQNRRTRWAPLLARQADNWAEYEAVRA
jgi:hypothetical protein